MCVMCQKQGLTEAGRQTKRDRHTQSVRYILRDRHKELETKAQTDSVPTDRQKELETKTDRHTIPTDRHKELETKTQTDTAYRQTDTRSQRQTHR